VQGLESHAASHGYGVTPLYEHCKFMMRHPDWTIESKRQEVERMAQQVEGYEYVRTTRP